MLALRARHPVLTQDTFWGEAVRFLDGSGDGPASGWTVGDLCVLANSSADGCEFALPGGPWHLAIDTAAPDCTHVLDPPRPIGARGRW